MSHSWDRFTKSITVRSTTEQLYRAFATRAGMESWFLRSCSYSTPNARLLPPLDLVNAGDKFRWHWFGYDDATDENGEILEANESDSFEFTFNSNGKTDMRVKINFEILEHDVRVNLTQYNIPEDDDSKGWYYVGCGEGWTFYLANLKSIFEGGIDLRNKDKMIKNVINS